MEGPLGFALDLPEGAAPTHVMLCCECGVQMTPNPASMCINCIRKHTDITEGIPKQAVLHFCRGCERYHSPPASWISCDLESRELLALCLKRLRGLNKVRLVDAGFIWTEPHSKRVKVKLTVQQEIFTEMILQQVFVVEYVVQGQFCDQCHRREASDTWNAVVQVRQKVRHKKTFHYLEQLIIKHHAHKQTVKIAARSDGIDFYYSSRSDARRMVEFFNAVVPIRFKTSERLISHDEHENTFNFKYTFSVEIVPICKCDVVCIPLPLARSMGGITQLLVCDRVGTSLHLVDPQTLQHTDVSAAVFWRGPFNTICDQAHLTEYCVLDIEPVYGPGGPITAGKYLLADALVARIRDLGVNDVQFMVRTHLGRILQAGDNVWGFDVQNANYNDENANKLDQRALPDVLLIKKSYTEKRKNRKRRHWKLKLLPKEEEPISKREEEANERDMEGFIRDLEEDPELRSTVNIYRDTGIKSATPSEAADEDFVGFSEMLDDFEGMALEDAAAGPDLPFGAAQAETTYGGEQINLMPTPAFAHHPAAADDAMDT